MSLWNVLLSIMFSRLTCWYVHSWSIRVVFVVWLIPWLIHFSYRWPLRVGFLVLQKEHPCVGFFVYTFEGEHASSTPLDVTSHTNSCTSLLPISGESPVSPPPHTHLPSSDIQVDWLCLILSFDLVCLIPNRTETMSIFSFVFYPTRFPPLCVTSL